MLAKEDIQNFKNCTQYIPTNKEIINLRECIYSILPITKYLVKKNNIIDPEELKLCIRSFAQAVFDDFSSTGYIDSRLYEIQTIESILRNPSIITKIYPSIKNSPNNHIIYNSNSLRSQRLVLINAFDELSTLEKFANNYGITAHTNPSNVVIHSNNAPELKKLVKLAINVSKQSSMQKKVSTILQEELKESILFVKEQLINSLMSIRNFLYGTGILGNYISSYEATSKKFGFSDLEYEFTTNSYNKDSLGLLESLSKDFLQTQSLDELCYLHAFWCNRFAKECNSFQFAYSSIDSIDLWQDIINGDTRFHLPDKVLVSALQKNLFMSKLLTKTFNIHQQNISSQEVKGEDTTDVLTKDYSNYYYQLSNYIGKDYTSFFSNNLNGRNNLLADISFANCFSNLKMYAYQKKETTIEPLIKNMLDKPSLKNWGIIRNEILCGDNIDTFDLNKNNILVAFDVPGFNMPFRFHVSRDALKDLSIQSASNGLVPEYQGSEDFVFNNEVIPSNIMMPIPKRHKKIITEKINSNNSNPHLWAHFGSLINGKLPSHLMQIITNNKNQVVSSRLPVCYTNMKTGQRYFKIDNNFIELEDGNVR